MKKKLLAFVLAALMLFASACVKPQPSGDDAADIAAAKAAIAAASFGPAAQADVNTEALAKAFVQGKLDGLDLKGVTAAVSGAFTAAAAGTAGNLNGVNGSYKFTVALTKGAASDTTGEITLTITATAYDNSADNAAISAAKNAVAGAAYGSVAQTSQSNTLSAAKAHVEGVIAGLALNGATATVTTVSFTAAQEGTASAQSGVNGTYTFTVTLAKGAGTSQTTGELTFTITAKAYDPAADSQDILDALGDIEAYNFTVPQEYLIKEYGADNIDAAEAYAQHKADVLALVYDVTAVVSGGDFTAAVKRDASNAVGENGAYAFTVALTKGAGTPQTTAELGLVIVVTEVFKVTFDTAGGTPSSASPLFFEAGDTYGTLPTVSKDGYDFDGWFRNTDGEEAVISTTTAYPGDHTVYAKWTAKQIPLTFDLNDATGSTRGSGGPSVPVAATYNSAVPTGTGITAPERDGYTFGGFYDDAAGTGTQWYNGSMTPSATVWNIIAENQTLYAKWTAKTITVTRVRDNTSGDNTINLTFDGDYATTSNIGTNFPASGTGYTKTNYRFSGYWTKDGRTTGDWGEEIVAELKVTTPVNHSVYLKWMAVGVYDFQSSRDPGYTGTLSGTHFPSVAADGTSTVSTGTPAISYDSAMKALKVTNPRGFTSMSIAFRPNLATTKGHHVTFVGSMKFANGMTEDIDMVMRVDFDDDYSEIKIINAKNGAWPANLAQSTLTKTLHLGRTATNTARYFVFAPTGGYDNATGSARLVDAEYYIHRIEISKTRTFDFEDDSNKSLFDIVILAGDGVGGIAATQYDSVKKAVKHTNNANRGEVAINFNKWLASGANVRIEASIVFASAVNGSVRVPDIGLNYSGEWWLDSPSPLKPVTLAPDNMSASFDQVIKLPRDSNAIDTYVIFNKREVDATAAVYYIHKLTVYMT